MVVGTRALVCSSGERPVPSASWPRYRDAADGVSRTGNPRVANAPWAIVPLNPNELKRESERGLKLLAPPVTSTRRIYSTGRCIDSGVFDDTMDDRCAFSLRGARRLINQVTADTTAISSKKTRGKESQDRT